MDLLLGTCTFLWLALDPAKVPHPVLEALQSTASSRYLSAASVWEITLKWKTGKLPLPLPPHELIPAVREAGWIQSLPITESATLHLPKLPAHHQDPFDRILICQAIESGLTLVTPDPAIHLYPVRLLWSP